MDNVRLIKKYFDFLKSNGYKRKTVTRNGDAEITYSNKKMAIEVSCDLGNSYISLLDNVSNIDALMNNSAYFVSVMIKYGYQGGNILYCDLLNKQARMKLKKDIDNAGNDIELALKTYSQFFKDNIIYFI